MYNIKNDPPVDLTHKSGQIKEAFKQQKKLLIEYKVDYSLENEIDNKYLFYKITPLYWAEDALKEQFLYGLAESKDGNSLFYKFIYSKIGKAKVLDEYSSFHNLPEMHDPTIEVFYSLYDAKKNT